MRKTTSPRVAVIHSASVPWIGLLLDGIRDYAASRGGWHLFTSPPTLESSGESALTLRSMRGWDGDALIVLSNEEKELRALRRRGIPAVNLAAGLSGSRGIPRVMVNHRKAGESAAEHLLERGLRNLAFFGWDGPWYSEQRCLGFSERAASGGAGCDVFLQVARRDLELSWPDRIGRIISWLGSLPLPVGIFAVHDYRALLLMEACQEAGLRVPDDVAIVGMDNDETVCRHSSPTLSSIPRNSRRIGWEAASILDRMMRGERCPEGEDLLLDPDEIVARQSTDILHCEEPVVRKALDFMRLHLRTQFNVERLADHAGVSKRTLETRFRESLGSSPHEFLTRMRVRHAKAIMRSCPGRTMEHTAMECGFQTLPPFYAAFRKITGESPGNFRRKFRLLPDRGNGEGIS